MFSLTRSESSFDPPDVDVLAPDRLTPGAKRGWTGRGLAQRVVVMTNTLSVEGAVDVLHPSLKIADAAII
jgi:hypothetical protein